MITPKFIEKKGTNYATRNKVKLKKNFVGT